MPVEYRYIRIQDTSPTMPWVGFEDMLSHVRDWDELKDALSGIPNEYMRRSGLSVPDVTKQIVASMLHDDEAHIGTANELPGLQKTIRRLKEDQGVRRALQIFLDLKGYERELDKYRARYFSKRKKYQSFIQRLHAWCLGKPYSDPDDQEDVHEAYRSYIWHLQEYEMMRDKR